MALVTVNELKSALQVGSLYSDETLQQICDASIEVISAIVTVESFAAEPAPMKEAALGIAVELFQQRTAGGGQTTGIDFTPSPYRAGKALVSRFAGLLAQYVDAEGIVG